MTPTPRNIWVQWRGERSGPFTEVEVTAKIKTGEIGGLYSVECNGTEMSAGDFLQAQQAKAPARVVPKPVITEKQKAVKTAPIQLPEVEVIAPIVTKAAPQPPSLPKVLPPVTTQSDRTSITIARNGQTFGPFSKELLTKYIGEGMFTSDDLAWHDGLPSWIRLGDIRLPGQSPTLPPLPSYPSPPPVPLPALPTMQGTQTFQHTQTLPTSSAQTTSAIYAGYFLCLISIFFFPPILGLAAFILGIIVIAQGNAGHGVAIILLSIICALAGMFFGAAIIAGSLSR